ALVPELDYRHPHDPSHVGDHILSSLIGTSESVPVRSGKLVLGTWQRVVLYEFDGPRERTVVVTTLPVKA
ncbi:MAG: YjbQ family protein, partial [Patescibacteria group bacterium]